MTRTHTQTHSLTDTHAALYIRINFRLLLSVLAKRMNKNSKYCSLANIDMQEKRHKFWLIQAQWCGSMLLQAILPPSFLYLHTYVEHEKTRKKRCFLKTAAVEKDVLHRQHLRLLLKEAGYSHTRARIHTRERAHTHAIHTRGARKKEKAKVWTTT